MKLPKRVPRADPVKGRETNRLRLGFWYQFQNADLISTMKFMNRKQELSDSSRRCMFSILNFLLP